MEYIYAAMMLHSAGKEITEDGIVSTLGAAGIDVDDARVKALVAALDGVDIESAIALQRHQHRQRHRQQKQHPLLKKPKKRRRKKKRPEWQDSVRSLDSHVRAIAAIIGCTRDLRIRGRCSCNC